MNTLALGIQMLIRLLALVLLALGLAFWTNNLRDLIPLHMLLGVLLVVCLWLLAVLAVRARAPAGLVLGSLLGGIIVVWLGLSQTGLLPGEQHWLVQVVHLASGVGAVGLAEALGRRIRTATL
ncbi:MAG: hypothetical protein M3336_00385 [Chloroflexota bacterium]|nr:hypothetical protein [Chloroflexota bacterium]